MTNKLTAKKFSTDFFEGKIFHGYSSGNTWNGWECPFFEFDEAAAITAVQNKIKEDSCYYEKEKDSFIFKFQDEIEEYPAEFIEEKKLYGIGSSIWIWEEAD